MFYVQTISQELLQTTSYCDYNKQPDEIIADHIAECQKLVNITEEINEKTLNGTKKVITQAKITNKQESKSCVDCGCDIYPSSIRCGTARIEKQSFSIRDYCV